MSVNREAHDRELKRISAEIKQREKELDESVAKLNAEDKRFEKELVKEANREQKSVDDQIDRDSEKIVSDIKGRGLTIKGGN